MSNTVITNYTDLNGPSTKADSSVVVIVNKDGSLSVDQNLLGTLMGSDGSQGAGISVVRVGHEGRPDDATDSESDDDKVPHVTLSVDSYYNEPNSIIKYDSGAEMLQSLRIETRENSLVGFQNDHCYTTLTSPSQTLPQQRIDNFMGYDEPQIEIINTPPPKPVPSTKKITILEQQIIPKGKKILINPSDASVILKGSDVLNKPLTVLSKLKHVNDQGKATDVIRKTEESIESSSISSSGDSIPDRDSDSDYKDVRDRVSSQKIKRNKLKPRILKSVNPTKSAKVDPKLSSRLKANKTLLRKENKEKTQQKNVLEKKQHEIDIESLIPTSEISLSSSTTNDLNKNVSKATPKLLKKEKKTPAHVTALLSDMTSLFSTPDVIRRVSTDGKFPAKPTDKETLPGDSKKITTTSNKPVDIIEGKLDAKSVDNVDKSKITMSHRTYSKQKDKIINPPEKVSKGYDLIPQLDDASLAQILQDTTTIANPVKIQPNVTTTTNTLSSPGLAGPLSPTLDLLGGLQPEEEGLTEDLLMHVAQLVESSENLQEVIDKQVLGKVDGNPKGPVQTPFQQAHTSTTPYIQTVSKSVKSPAVRKDPIEIVRKDGRVITLPPIEAPATRSSKRKSQIETTATPDGLSTSIPVTPTPVATTPEPQVQAVSKQYINKKLLNKKQEPPTTTPIVDKISAESQESWNSEDDPNRLWCICRQPHNNRFMICCDGCEDWFHGKCVNITKTMGQQMEEQGIEWRCPNCVKKSKPSAKAATKDSLATPSSSSKTEGQQGKLQEKQKADSRVIVYERKTGRILAGPNAPTAENLKAWLQKNPTFEVVRPGTLSAIKPNISKRKLSNEPHKIQTTLNFEKIPRKNVEQSQPAKSQQVENKEKTPKNVTPTREDSKIVSQPKTPVTPRPQASQYTDTPKPSTSFAKTTHEPRKLVRGSLNRSQSTQDKVSSVSPSTSRRKDAGDNKHKMNSPEPIRENVRKALQEQMTSRMAEHDGPRFSEEEIQQFVYDTEDELHELFKDVGMKYKAKYRSLMFNIKDRKNLSLWQKICDRVITPKELVRLSPEELASQELAEWRDQEAKHQLELIKKSELDLLAANKTYVLKTHKGEEVMETKESVSTELDPNVPVEDVVAVLNDKTVGEDVLNEISQEPNTVKKEKKYGRKKGRDDKSSSHTKKSNRESKRDSEKRKSQTRKRALDEKSKESHDDSRSTRRSDKRKSKRTKSDSKDRSNIETKEKSDSERSRHRSQSRAKSKQRSKSREHSRSKSKGRDEETSRSRTRSRRRSPSVSSRRRRSSRSKRSNSIDEKFKQRSRSQENTSSKNKNDSTDSDSVERPKSAMLKESHPEYDPHEPMITSAFSDEDLRKSREDVFENSFKNDIDDFGGDFDPTKTFSIDTNITLPTAKQLGKQDRISEAESDQEPSSTSAIVWNGCINMVDVARFYVAAHEVSGSGQDLEEDLNTELDIVGRINPDTVWDYIGKMKRASNKDIVILKLQAANDEEKMQYIALYSYLSSRNRLGVVKVSSTTSVKDFYIVPLPANTTLPPVLLPLEGPGLGEAKMHLLIAIVIRQRKKRPATHIPKDIVPAKLVRESRKRSYTPPLVSRSTYTPPTSPRRRPLPLPTYTSPALSTSVKDKIAASLASADDEEAYSPGSSSSGSSSQMPVPPPTSSTLRCKMEELNRQIEEQKQQILKMAQADSSVGEDEAYSPSRPMTPPPATVVPLADIALPSNLQEILATIKQRETTTADVDMRTLPLP
ncbi:death-inducer obliterator 1 isoform X2 [Achroia grisella]|uniref:death-inducer obliterator 1 isoform X2 n=1 Tax=Achroia grisella TaxID=688607 RepID=UPI0027D2963C|nr:death-inducer obliterator 1 isoform X2 [Achroia grisella]